MTLHPESQIVSSTESLHIKSYSMWYELAVSQTEPVTGICKGKKKPKSHTNNLIMFYHADKN